MKKKIGGKGWRGSVSFIPLNLPIVFCAKLKKSEKVLADTFLPQTQGLAPYLANSVSESEKINKIL